MINLPNIFSDKALYLHVSSAKGRAGFDRIRSAFDSYDAKLNMHYICLDVKDLDSKNGRLYMSYCSDGALANRIVQFWTEYIAFWNGSATVPAPTPAPAAAAPSSPWLCSCGRQNTGKFCPGCGAKMDGKECVPRKCGTCSNDGWDMPQCRECNEENGFKWYKRKMDAEVENVD